MPKRPGNYLGHYAVPPGGGNNSEKTVPGLWNTNEANILNKAGRWARVNAPVQVIPGSLYSWGYNGRGQLGDGTTTNRSIYSSASSPVDTNLWIAAAISDQPSGHSFVILNDRTLHSAGFNNYGQLADGTLTTRSTFAPAAAGSWISCAAGSMHSLLVKSDGTLHSVGYNYIGQLGDGTTSDNSVLSQVGGDTNWANVIASHDHSFAIKTDGTLWAWGNNTNGQLGDGSTTARSSPVQVGSATWTKISPNQFHVLGIQQDGTLWAWGANGNRFGDGTTNNSSTPVQIGSDTWIDIAAGRSHSVGVKADGTLWGWGYSARGAHGSGTSTLSVPTQIGSKLDWVSVAAGSDYSEAIDSSGSRYMGGKDQTTNSNLGTFGQSEILSSPAVIWSLVAVRNFSVLAIGNVA